MKIRPENKISDQNFVLDITNKKLYTHGPKQVSKDSVSHTFKQLELLADTFLTTRDNRSVLVGYARAVLFMKNDRIVIY